MSEGINVIHAWELVDHYLANLRFDRAVDYLQRGRRFAGKKTFQLKFDWRDLYDHFDDVDGSTKDWTALHDLEAELTLRGEGTPKPRPARGVNGRWREQHMERLRGDPAKWGSTERNIFEAAQAFRRECQHAVKH